MIGFTYCQDLDIYNGDAVRLIQATYHAVVLGICMLFLCYGSPIRKAFVDGPIVFLVVLFDIVLFYSTFWCSMFLEKTMLVDFGGLLNEASLIVPVTISSPTDLELIALLFSGLLVLAYSFGGILVDNKHGFSNVLNDVIFFLNEHILGYLKGSFEDWHAPLGFADIGVREILTLPFSILYLHQIRLSLSAI
jgi:hypothetical protein